MNHTRTNKKALIIGGGIAGPVTAMALQHAGIDAVIYEAYDTSAGLDAGAFLTVAVNGLDALRALGAHEPVLDAGFPTRNIEVGDAELREETISPWLRMNHEERSLAVSPTRERTARLTCKNLPNAARVISPRAVSLRCYIKRMKCVNPDTGKVSTPC